MNATPVFQSAKITEPYRFASGSLWILITALVTRPRLPLPPNAALYASTPATCRGVQYRFSTTSTGPPKGDVLDDVLDVAVAVPLHAAGVGGDPPAQGGQLHAVGLVAAGEAVLLQQFLQPAPRMPAWTQAVRLSASTHSMAFIRRMSSDTTVRVSSGICSASETLVPPP